MLFLLLSFFRLDRADAGRWCAYRYAFAHTLTSTVGLACPNDHCYIACRSAIERSLDVNRYQFRPRASVCLHSDCIIKSQFSQTQHDDVIKGHKINTHTDSITTHMSAICVFKANNATRVMNLISVPLFTHMCARFHTTNAHHRR